MIMGMSDKDASAFLERISAAAIVNQAMLKCSLAGLDLTPDNVILFVGDFVDPNRPNFQGLIEEIDRSVDEMFSVTWQQKRDHLRSFHRKN